MTDPWAALASITLSDWCESSICPWPKPHRQDATCIDQFAIHLLSLYERGHDMNAKATATTNALPTLTAINPASVPVSARQSVATDAEVAYVNDLVSALTETGAVSAGPFADAKLASASAGKIKRLVKRLSPNFPADGMALRWSTGAVDGGAAWFVRVGEPSKAGKPKNGS